MDLKCFKVFNNLRPEFASQVKLAYTWGSATTGFLVLQNDDVHCAGSDSDGILRNRGVYSTTRGVPPKISELCQERIKDFKVQFGEDTVLALSEDGSIFEWCGTIVPIFRCLSLKNVIQIDCGAFHNLALTSDGLVYAWGDNLSGQLGVSPKDVDERDAPDQVRGFRTASGGAGGGDSSEVEEKIISIACGSKSSFALTADGNLWGWGYGTETGLVKYAGIPRIILDGVTRVAAGWQHFFAVKGPEKTLYFWDQRATPSSRTSTDPPQPVCWEIARADGEIERRVIKGVIDVGATVHYCFNVYQANTMGAKIRCGLSAIQVEDGRVYIIGNNGFCTVPLSPCPTGYASVDQAFASHRFPTMCRSVEIRSAAV